MIFFCMKKTIKKATQKMLGRGIVQYYLNFPPSAMGLKKLHLCTLVINLRLVDWLKFSIHSKICSNLS